jgi:hypothetical protein
MATTPPEAKKHKGSITLLDLNDDALRAILLRTCASDHTSLRQTCRRIREVLDSPLFAQQRCEECFVEVSVVMHTPWEQYSQDRNGESVSSKDSCFVKNYDDLGYVEECYEYTTFSGRILADGRKAGDINATLLPRMRSRGGFHEMCDAKSGDTEALGVTFFNDRGKPRVKSVKDALGKEIYRESLLYVDHFELQPEYRTTTTVGTQALRYLLMEETLYDRWSIAMYVADSNAQLTKEDRITARKIRSRDPHACLRPTDEQLQEDRTWNKRLNTLSIIDMRQFLRSGFLQAKETVADSDCYYVFAVPSLLTENLEMSHDEALAIEVAEKPPPPPEPSADALILLGIMKDNCPRRKMLSDSIESWREPVAENRHMREMVEFLEEPRKMLTSVVDRIKTRANEVSSLFEVAENEGTDPSEKERAIQEIRSILTGLGFSEDTSNVTELKDKWKEILSRDESVQEVLKNMEVQRAGMEGDFPLKQQHEITRLEQELCDLDARVRSEVSKLVDESGYDLILSSDSIHCCACNNLPLYVKLLLDFIPNDKKNQAINKLDQHGSTPLMVAARRDNKESLDTCNLIISLGGDKSIVNANGLTALGSFRQSQKSSMDFWTTTGLISMKPATDNGTATAMEALLMPSNGPTDADNAVQEADEESSVGDERDAYEMNYEDEEDFGGSDEDEDVED